MLSIVTVLVSLNATALIGFAQDLMQDSFVDGDIGIASDGLYIQKCQGTGSQELVSGDLILESNDGWSMWCVYRYNGERITPGSEWSFRADMTFESGFLAVGKQSYHHAGLHADRLRAGINQDNVAVDLPYDVQGERVIIQVDVLDNTIDGYLWRDGDPESLVNVFFDRAYPVVEFPSFGVSDGSSTIHEMWISTTPISRISGDFNSDGSVDEQDVDQLTQATRIESDDSRFDLKRDQTLDFADRGILVRETMNTYFGDANLDDEFNSGDFVQVFQIGKYETGQEAGWGEGDWDGDAVFSSGDFVAAFQDGGYERGPRGAEAAVVPEPCSAQILITAVIYGTLVWRRKERQPV
ncbi:MAG: hypothetical protein KDA92_01210 [Planctomycetales bacterium]|nr:hypothetical protein [Planctomycetales bacterium]